MKYLFTQRHGYKAFLILGLLVLSTITAFTAVPFQTDIWTYTGASWYGDNIYETPATTQILATSVAPGVKASYTIRLTNDGNQPDTHWLNGSSVPTGWTVKLTEVATGMDITDRVLGISGWGNRATGALKNVLVEITPGAAITSGTVFDFSLTFASENDSSKKDTAKLSTTVNGSIPDGQIRLNNGSFLGNNVYDTDRTVQLTNRSILGGNTTSFVIRVQNDGNTAGTFTVTGSANMTGWLVTYYEFNGGANITSAVTGAGKTTPTLNPGNVYVIVAQVQSIIILPGALTYNGQVAFTNASVTDIVGFDVNSSTAFQPDALIYEAGSTSYIGNNIFSSMGTGQTENRNLGPNGATTYYVRVQNDGIVPEVFNLTAPASSGSFIIAYIDSYTGANITAAVTGAGWTTNSIPPTGTRAIKAVVKAAVSVSSGETLTIDVTATSVTDISKSDTVRAITIIAP